MSKALRMMCALTLVSLAALAGVTLLGLLILALLALLTPRAMVIWLRWVWVG